MDEVSERKHDNNKCTQPKHIKEAYDCLNKTITSSRKKNILKISSEAHLEMPPLYLLDMYNLI